jgi:hypothetical protein
MKTASPVDAARIELLLSDLRLPAIKLMWAKLAEQQPCFSKVTLDAHGQQGTGDGADRRR